MNKEHKLYENRPHFESIVSKFGGIKRIDFYETHLMLTSKVLANLANNGLQGVFESKLIVCANGKFYSNVKRLKEYIRLAKKGTYTQIPYMYYEVVLESLELILTVSETLKTNENEN